MKHAPMYKTQAQISQNARKARYQLVKRYVLGA